MPNRQRFVVFPFLVGERFRDGLRRHVSPPEALFREQPRPEQFQLAIGGDAERDRRPIHVAQSVQIDQSSLGVNVLAEMILAPEGGVKGLRQFVGMGGPRRLARRVAGRAEQPRQFAEGVDRVALGHAVPFVSRRQFDVEPRAADQPVLVFQSQQVFRGRFERGKPLAQPRRGTGGVEDLRGREDVADGRQRAERILRVPMLEQADPLPRLLTGSGQAFTLRRLVGEDVVGRLQAASGNRPPGCRP